MWTFRIVVFIIALPMWKDYVGEKWVCPLEDWGLQREAESGEFVDFLESRV